MVADFPLGIVREDGLWPPTNGAMSFQWPRVIYVLNFTGLSRDQERGAL